MSFFAFIDEDSDSNRSMSGKKATYRVGGWTHS